MLLPLENNIDYLINYLATAKTKLSGKLAYTWNPVKDSLAVKNSLRYIFKC
jgi:hypothetical protein